MDALTLPQSEAPTLVPARERSWARIAAWSYLSAIFLFLFVPNSLVAIMSFNGSRIAGFPISNLTTSWWSQMFANGVIWEAMLNSLLVAFATMVLTVGLGLLSAYALVRYEFPLKPLFTGLLFAAMVIPYLVFGIALLSFYALLDVERSLATVVLAHVALSLPFTTLVLAARLEGFDRSIEEAAASLGAKPPTIWRRITLPLLMPGIVAGAALAFTTSFDEFNVAYFVIGVHETTVPLYIYSSLKFGLSPELNALSTLTLGISIVLAALALGRSRA